MTQRNDGKPGRPQIIVDSDIQMQDEEIKIEVKGLKPHRRVTLHSSTDSASPGKWFEAVAVYKADKNGCVDLTTDASLGGSYKGIEPMGLFWSLKSSPKNDCKNIRFIKPDVTKPLVVRIGVYNAEVDSIESFHGQRSDLESKLLDSIDINRLYMQPGTTRTELSYKKDGIQGILLVPPGKGPFPGLITMFGGSPGTWDFKGSLLARHGYVTLALAFHGEELEEIHPRNEGLTTLTMDYFHKAIDFLRSHPKIDMTSGGFGVLSISGIVHVSLLMSVHSPYVKCVVCTNGPIYNLMGDFIISKDKTYPSIKHYDGEGFTLHEDEQDSSGIIMRTLRCFLESISPIGDTDPPGASIPFHRQKHVGFLYLASLDDDNVPSEYFANVFECLLKSSNHPNFKVARYPGAGHLLEPPYGPHNYFTSFPYFGTNLLWGGETKAHCKAQLSSWNETLQFLRKNLNS